MRKEEKMIKDMKKGRVVRIIVCIIILIMMSAVLAFVIHKDMKLDALITPENVKEMASLEDLKTELPILFCRFHTLASYSSKLMFYGMYFASFIGLFLVLLIIEIAGLGYRRLIVSMWERIQRLEQKLKDLPEQDGQQTDPADS